jgi:plastocyanin
MKLIYSLAFGIGAFFTLNCGSGDDGGGYPTSGGAAPTSGGGSTTSASDPAVVEVKVNGHDFEPQDVHIKANQTVRWVWVTGSHNVVSGSACTPDGTFSSGNSEGAPNTFEHTFTKAGSFPYFCDPHCSIGMKGNVIVE